MEQPRRSTTFTRKLLPEEQGSNRCFRFLEIKVHWISQPMGGFCCIGLTTIRKQDLTCGHCLSSANGKHFLSFRQASKSGTDSFRLTGSGLRSNLTNPAG